MCAANGEKKFFYFPNMNRFVRRQPGKVCFHLRAIKIQCRQWAKPWITLEMSEAMYIKRVQVLMPVGLVTGAMVGCNIGAQKRYCDKIDICLCTCMGSLSGLLLGMIMAISPLTLVPAPYVAYQLSK